MLKHEHRPPILQEDENDDENENTRLDQGDVNLVDRGLDEFRRVERQVIFEALREALRELLHFRVHRLGHRDGISLRQLKNADTGRRSTVLHEGLAVGLGAEFDAADIADAGNAAALSALDLDDDVFVVCRLVQPKPLTFSVYWKTCPFGTGGMPIW